MDFLLRILCIAQFVVFAEARGPLCLYCDLLPSPELCRTVAECKPSESCFSEPILQPDGNETFSFGCRLTQFCPRGSRIRTDLSMCAECCIGDLCNNNICTNGTAAPPGIPCLTCSEVPSTSECAALAYCSEGEVCSTHSSTHNVYETFNMGCLKKETCNAFKVSIIGKREVGRACHACCETPGCNHGACANLQKTPAPQTTVSTTNLPPARDCWDLRRIYNKTVDGVYEVLAPDGKLVQVYCDMTTDGGGWIVFQKRYNGAVDFDQTYANYASGFGSLSTEFWLGNELLHKFTDSPKQTLRVDLCDWFLTTRHVTYDTFLVGPAFDFFRLRVEGYKGDAGDALIRGFDLGVSNDRRFAASDTLTANNCGKNFYSGWWFNACFNANLNGVYQHTSKSDAFQGIIWRTWKDNYSLPGTEMKFRPSSARPTSHEPFKCPVH